MHPRMFSNVARTVRRVHSCHDRRTAHMRYVVTGAAGFIGSHLANSLSSAGHDVVGVDCFTDYYDPALKEHNAQNFDVVRRDLAEDALTDIINGADGVYHLAAQPGVRSFGDVFRLYARRNIVATQRLFEAAARARVRVVFASSSSVYGDAETYPTPEDLSPLPISPYSITKFACEHLARAYERNFGLDFVTLRYFTVYGPRQRPDMAFARIVDALLRDTTFELYGAGAHSRSFTYVTDAVDATITAMDRAPANVTYNVGGGSEATLSHAIEILEAISGLKLRVRVVPHSPGDVFRTSADSRRIRDALGWEPSVTLEDGLRRQWEWAKSRAVAPRRPTGGGAVWAS